jgi:peptidoglycan/xylan/chitin deacetylase (PgdA/CDA1 family)
VAGESGLNVSVIIPTYNAAETVAETFASLRAQTHGGWEAVIVDDGSDDDTVAHIQSLSAHDARIRLITQRRMGVSAARNTGINAAHFDWLLFLDADDWLAPQHLEHMTQALTTNPDLDAAHCGWARVAPDGTRVGEKYGPESTDLFPVLACLCAFSVHACVVRRSMVEDVGGFDAALHTCEDWDLWQRIARAGARFGAVHEVLALYRIRPRSASSDGARFLADGLRGITQGHSPDPRVRNPVPGYADGLARAQLPSVRLNFASWPAGLVLGAGADARPLIPLLGDDRDPGLAPDRIAECLFESALLPTCRTPDAWRELWPHLQPRIDEFLTALEGQSMAPRLAHRAHAILERMVLAHSKSALPLTVGITHGVRVELTAPIPDISLSPSVDRLQCFIELEGAPIGTLELPVAGGVVLNYVLADAIAAMFSWPILGRFFERTLYPNLNIEKDDSGLTLLRGDRRLASGLPDNAPLSWQALHDCIGWAVFLQEVWGCPDRALGWFYQDHPPVAPTTGGWRRAVRAAWKGVGRLAPASSAPNTAAPLRVDGDRLAVEISAPLSGVEVAGPRLDVLLTVGGVALGVIPIHVRNNLVRAEVLRARLTQESGLELCRAAVREGILGKPITGEPTSLRARLAVAAAAQGSRGRQQAVATHAVGQRPCDGVSALSRAVPSGARAVALGRRAHGAIETSVSRRAMLPAAVADAFLQSASLAGDPILHVPQTSPSPDYMVYMPDQIAYAIPPEPAPAAGVKQPPRAHPADTAAYGRSHFESLFAAQPDPWRYTNPYERTKYAQTLALLPKKAIGRALELACAEGHFTAQLAPRVGSLTAADISQIALGRAAEHCAGLENVRFHLLDLTKDALPGRFDLIVCSEVLYYSADVGGLRAIARKLADATEPGGYLLTAHANLVVDDPHQTGFDWDCPFGAKVIGEVLANTRPLRLVKELRTPLYRIQLFRRDTRRRLPLRRNVPETIECLPAEELPPEVASHVLWNGGRLPSPGGTRGVVTDRLPILMYHRVSPTGSAAMTRYRVSPEAFEGQLRYLREAGYYSLSLEDWRVAMQTKKPPPGRAVLITFDDGYLDFHTYAWPLLKRYGFSATVFLVTGAVGQSNSWDRAYGEQVPLLGTRAMIQLRDEGVTFGSHSVSHRPLTGLSPEEIAREGIESRLTLERSLSVPIHAFAYPYGDTDQVVQHLIGACGYIFGLSCRSSLSNFEDSLLALPRIEVGGSDRFQDFVAKLGARPAVTKH